jgi:hypothetical protein
VLRLHTQFHREYSLQNLGLSFYSDTHVVALLDPSLELGARISVGEEHVLRLLETSELNLLARASEFLERNLMSQMVAALAWLVLLRLLSQGPALNVY